MRLTIKTALSGALLPLLLCAGLSWAAPEDAQSARAGTDASASADATVEPANPALAELMRMAEFLAGRGRFQVSLTSGFDVVQENGQKIEFGEQRDILLLRPDRLRVDVAQSDGNLSTIVFDGVRISVYNKTQNLYAASEMRGDVDAAIKHFVKDLNMRLPLAMLLVTSLPEELKQRVQEAAIVGTAQFDGQSFTHLAVRADDVDFQLWLPDSGDPLPRRIVLTYREEQGQPQYWAHFSDWNLKPSPPSSRFAVELPADVERIQFLTNLTSAEVGDALPGDQP
ncbi:MULTISPECIES: DUF2092 domain-containing protein [Thiorhodovibrio]|uniref:DUF2092 domain-containing protein n=1 Tax=Thiorhodovibrio TaxID=61593 RepID=UPI0019118857|nr:MULTISPECIES: DUF2092 domain-containing protein [Thiorhodovibrio]WPL14890.1 Outer membrane lipoprotein-sorting protein [Thiorhodovibrio litoralis]